MSNTVTAIDAQTAEILQSYGFKDIPFESLKNRLASGAASADENTIKGKIEAPQPGDVNALPPPGSDARTALHQRGLQAIKAGEVGAVILAGGMATRFGGVVKASVEVVDGKTFLELKLADICRIAERAEAKIPVYLMSSFATDAALKADAKNLSAPNCPVTCFSQFVSLRLNEDGSPFIDHDGKASPYAPGHGDLSFALRRSGILKSFIDGGGRVLMMSNVDNLTATLDPAIIGAHLEGGKAITAEMAPKEPGDKGGAPARVDGVPQIVEAFRFPEDFDQDSIPVFNTNTLVFDARAIDRDFDLTWFEVRKQVDGKSVIQFERLVGELTGILPTQFLRVERHGPDARFQPIKTPEDLDTMRDEIRNVLSARGAL